MRESISCSVKEQSIKGLYVGQFEKHRAARQGVGGDYCSFKGTMQEKERQFKPGGSRYRMPAELQEPMEASGIAGEMEEEFQVGN